MICYAFTCILIFLETQNLARRIYKKNYYGKFQLLKENSLSWNAVPLRGKFSVLLYNWF